MISLVRWRQHRIVPPDAVAIEFKHANGVAVIDFRHHMRQRPDHGMEFLGAAGRQLDIQYPRIVKVQCQFLDLLGFHSQQFLEMQPLRGECDVRRGERQDSPGLAPAFLQ